MIETITNEVRITVKSNYIPERSDPSKPIYFFAYHINIKNNGSKYFWKIYQALNPNKRSNINNKLFLSSFDR